MKLLLDTHGLLWWLNDDSRLMRAADLIADPANDILVGVASPWEIVVNTQVGKLEADIKAIELAIVRDGFQRLAISEDATLISDDEAMSAYPVRVVTCGAAA